MPAFLHNIRTATHNGSPMFHVNDIAKVLGTPSSKRLLDALDEDEFVALDGATYVSEPGFYRLALNLHRPRAGLKRFVCHTILPSLREHARFSVGRKVAPEAVLLQAIRETLAATGAGVDQPASADAA